MSLINDLGINKGQKKTKTKNNTFQILGNYYFKLKNTILNMKIFKIVYKSTYEEYIGIFSEFAISPSLRQRKIYQRVLAIRDPSSGS
jgi:hypothetical protein